jgi:antitoxin VapB
MQTTKVFKSGNSQAIRLPKEYQFKTTEQLYINKIGNALVILPKNDPWTLFKQSLTEFSSDFMTDGRSQPQTPKRRFNF